ncbi:hypothetical protein NMY22_g18020 [Coprinellus aureogranulatus]|nr:hypothetical protein NMY22_g18020 [Coprinellus aureogranulatus]
MPSRGKKPPLTHRKGMRSGSKAPKPSATQGRSGLPKLVFHGHAQRRAKGDNVGASSDEEEQVEWGDSPVYGSGDEDEGVQQAIQGMLDLASPSKEHSKRKRSNTAGTRIGSESGSDESDSEVEIVPKEKQGSGMGKGKSKAKKHKNESEDEDEEEEEEEDDDIVSSVTVKFTGSWFDFSPALEVKTGLDMDDTKLAYRFTTDRLAQAIQETNPPVIPDAPNANTQSNTETSPPVTPEGGSLAPASGTDSESEEIEIEKLLEEAGLTAEELKMFEHVLASVGVEIDSGGLEDDMDDPKSWKEARDTDDGEEREEAAWEDLDSLKEMKVYELVPLEAVPKGMSVRKVKLVFKQKKDELGKTVRRKVRSFSSTLQGNSDGIYNSST